MMTTNRTVLSVLGAAALMLVAGGCPGPADMFASGSGSGGAGSSGVGPGSGSGGGAAQTGIPCDVATILANNCLGCHSNPPVANAPMPLVTYADLAAPSPKGGTYADRALVRMQDAVAPMPPAPAAPVSAADIATFAAWINAGMPMGDCNQGSGGSGAGGGNPYNTPEVCTSMQYWPGGESRLMDPGRACISCHQNSGGEAPLFAIGGTVYPTAHEPNDCYGVDGTIDGTQVVITDAQNNVVNLNVHSTGNFDSGGQIVVFPIHAKVIRGGKTRAMSQAVSTGDCNSCHTLNGAGNPPAPGRIMAP